MNVEDLSDEEVVEKLRAHPELKSRLVLMLRLGEDESGQLREGDAAEMQFVGQLRQMGREVLTAWAQRQGVQTSREVSPRGSVWREGKKNGAGGAEPVRNFVCEAYHVVKKEHVCQARRNR